ncbi:MAG TPA: hypothetical protein VE959_20695 [Bryobacteraceae bacterium]|nr:hypothetical protein [Bryobacteraceae bacterium]
MTLKLSPALAILTLAGFASVAGAQTPITSGISQTVSLDDTYICFALGFSGCVIFVGGPFTITVPANAYRMDVVTSNGLLVYGRFGSAPAVGTSSILSDFSTSDAASLLGYGNQALQTGTYYFQPADIIYTSGEVKMSATLTVTVWADNPFGPTGVSPAAGGSSSQTMTFVFNDPVGWQDMGVLNILANNFLDGRNACYLAYSQPSNTLYLVNDSGAGLLPAAVLNAAGTLANSQCTVSWGAAPVTRSGTSLALALNLASSAAFAGNKVIYMAARTTAEQSSGWQAMGVWRIPAQLTTTTAVESESPGRGAATATFSFKFSDTKGFQDLGVMDILVNNFLDGRQACYLAYARATNTLYLMNDAGNGLLPGQLLSVAGSLGNGQCTVTWGSSGVVNTSGNELSLNLNLEFGAGFTGNRVFYLAARDGNEANNTGWQAMATWTVQ